MEMGFHMKPSIGIEGEWCVCTQPGSSHELALQQEAYKEELRAKLSVVDMMNVPRERITHLYQSDFLHGTYRIREGGIYVVMEDIVFDFNAADASDPLAEGAWWPRPDQEDESRDAYFLGFCAGITFEADNVILELNGHELAMSDARRRW